MSELPTDIDMASTALLVMDYQPMVLSPMRDAVNLLYRTKEAIGLMRDAGALVAYVRLALDDTDYASIPGTNKSFSRIGTNRYVHEDEPGTAIHHEIAPRGADLDRKLKTAGITTLILAGIHSSGVMLSTIRDAADRDYRLLVLTDCTSDPDAELHEVLMSKVFPRQAYMTTIADLKALISRQ
jgi:nicotinamidase-related amidase